MRGKTKGSKVVGQAKRHIKIAGEDFWLKDSEGEGYEIQDCLLFLPCRRNEKYPIGEGCYRTYINNSWGEKYGV